MGKVPPVCGEGGKQMREDRFSSPFFFLCLSTTSACLTSISSRLQTLPPFPSCKQQVPPDQQSDPSLRHAEADDEEKGSECTRISLLTAEAAADGMQAPRCRTMLLFLQSPSSHWAQGHPFFRRPGRLLLQARICFSPLEQRSEIHVSEDEQCEPVFTDASRANFSLVSHPLQKGRFRGLVQWVSSRFRERDPLTFW